MIELIALEQLIYDLSFLQPAVSERRQCRIPVAEAILCQHPLYILRLQDILQHNSFCLTVVCQNLFAFYNIVFLEFLLEPLCNLIACLRALDDLQPVAAWPTGVL